MIEIPLDVLFELAEQKQAKALAFLKKEKGKSFAAEEIASAIGSPEEVETVSKLLDHAAANMDHPIKKIPGPLHSVHSISTSREMGRKSNSKLGQIENISHYTAPLMCYLMIW